MNRERAIVREKYRERARKKIPENWNQKMAHPTSRRHQARKISRKRLLKICTSIFSATSSSFYIECGRNFHFSERFKKRSNWKWLIIFIKNLSTRKEMIHQLPGLRENWRHWKFTAFTGNRTGQPLFSFFEALEGSFVYF